MCPLTLGANQFASLSSQHTICINFVSALHLPALPALRLTAGRSIGADLLHMEPSVACRASIHVTVIARSLMSYCQFRLIMAYLQVLSAAVQ